MSIAMRTALLVAIIISSLFVSADDQKKAEKQVNKISAMAADLTGRRVVNQSMAEQLKLKRSDLVLERRENNLNYGALFVVHQLTTNGAKLSDITGQLRSGKKLFEVANQLHADWKQIADDAKKLNNRIEDNLYKYFMNRKGEQASDPADVYNALIDGVTADATVSEQDLADAQERYIFWRDRATAKQDGTLELNKEQAARQTFDPVRKGGPNSDQVGNTGPAANVTPH
jgi:hypothetical protein